MSNLAGSPTLAQPSTPATPSSAAPPCTPYPAESANGNFSRTTSTSELPTSASATENQGESSRLNGGPPKPIVAVNVDAVLASARQRGAQKGRTAEETEAMAQTAARVAQRIAEDQMAVLQPDVETPFADAADVVRRLLPYHIFQHPAEDLHTLSGRKGKRKATEEDLLREEIAETKFALDCWRRKAALERRFRNARINAGRRAAPDDQAYVLAQAVVDAERQELASLNSEYRSARAELDKIEREKKAAAAAAAAAAATPSTPVASRMPYYPPPSSSAPTSSTFSVTPTTYTPSTYRNYSFSYGTPYTYSQTSTNGASPTTPKTPGPSARVPTNVPILTLAPPNTTAAPTKPTYTGSSTPLTATAAPTGAAIPVQLPVSSLMSLSALGIVPVPAANAPPADQPQPACVLKGTTQNGTMVSLEINVSALGAAQASGLAVLLSAITGRNNVAVTSAPSYGAPSNTPAAGESSGGAG